MTTAVAERSGQLSFAWMQEDQSSPTNTRPVSQIDNSRSIKQRNKPALAKTVPSVAIEGRGMRVGQAKMGHVMMGLLKRYGITEAEIQAVLSSIAQEQCQNLAG